MSYIKISQVAERLNVSPNTVYKRVSRGDIPAYRIGRLIRIDERDLEKYMKQNQTEGARR